jgi:hypothetical protein
MTIEVTEAPTRAGGGVTFTLTVDGREAARVTSSDRESALTLIAADIRIELR